MWGMLLFQSWTLWVQEQPQEVPGCWKVTNVWKHSSRVLVDMGDSMAYVRDYIVDVGTSWLTWGTPWLT